MAWDSTRPIPWRRFAKEGVVFALGMCAVLFVFAGERELSGFVGVTMGAAIYVVLAGVMSKFGYERKTFKQLRAETAAAPPRRVGNTAPARPRPQPTKRTSTGPAHRSKKPRR